MMASCRICIDDMKKPVSLPCGHLFCSECIVKIVQNIKPYSHLQPCPICRSMYNIAPINLNVVPPNLRPYVTPSIRRVYLDAQPTPEEKGASETVASSSTTPDTASELQRLRAENEVLRSNCRMWRKRAEMHGSANLGLINFAKVVRDQAARLGRERDSLRTRCRLLMRKLEDVEMAGYSEATLSEPLFDSNVDSEHSKKPDPTSLLFAPPFRYPSEPLTSSVDAGVKRVRDLLETEPGDPSNASTGPPGKRVKVQSSSSPAVKSKDVIGTHTTPPSHTQSPPVNTS